MPYDMTQMRAHLQGYMQRINDSMTSDADVQRYGGFVEKLQNLANQTERHYKERIPFTAEERAALRTSYTEAIDAVSALLTEEETGPVGLRLRLIGRELAPLLLADMQAIALTERDPELGQLSLPELLGKVRTQAADLGEQPGPEGDAPMPLRVEALDNLQVGVFRPTKPDDFGGQQTAYSRLAALLGQPNLVTKAEPMLLMHKGGSTAGSFLPSAAGVDPANIQPGLPLLSFGEENLDTQAGVSGLASMQLLDFLCGAAGRGPEHCCLRFNPPYSMPGNPAKLVGLTVKADGAVFGDAPADEAQIAALGMIPEALYNQLTAPGFEAQLRFALQDCALPAGTVERILARRAALIQKVEADRAAFADKGEGYLEAGKVRLASENELGSYHLKDLKAVNPDSAFAKLLELPQNAKAQLQNRPAQPGAALPTTPTARIVGNGLRQEPDPLNLNRPETVRLHISALDKDTIQKGAQNQRYPLQWTENGQTRRGMFTLPKVLSRKAAQAALLDEYENNPSYAEYRDVFRAIREYFDDSEAGRGLSELPGSAGKLPWRDMGFSEARFEQIKNDNYLSIALGQLGMRLGGMYRTLDQDLRTGHARGERVELRNVAMSDIAETLGVPGLLAKSTPAQVELDGKLVDGIFMEEAEGEDFKKALPGTAMASITAEQAKTVFNTKGLKDLADIQILDYICLNQDRHPSNMFYRFEGLETGNPRFLGVQGIDNDFSFGTLIPPDDKQINRNMPKLDDIRVISESMARTLRSQELRAGIAEKMRRNGLSQAEIDAAQKRLEKLQTKLQKGKLRVVKDNEWGTGNYTYEKLAEGQDDTSIFHTFKTKMVDTLTQRARNHPVQPGNYKAVQKPKYQEAQRVERFGDVTLKAEAAKKQEQQARQRFTGFSEEGLKTQAEVDNPEHQALIGLHERVGKLKAALERGSLPWPWGSGEYRTLCGACDSLRKLTEKLTKQLRQNPKRELSEAESQELQDRLDELSDCATAYSNYKHADLEEYAEGRYTQARMQASEACAEVSVQLKQNYLQARSERKRPLHLVREKIQELQAGLSGKTGEALKKQTAQILYLNGLTRTEFSKRSGQSVRKALHPNTLNRMAEKFMAEPGFQKLTARPENELRALAAGKGGRELGDRFIRELAQLEQPAPAPREAQNPDLQPQRQEAQPQPHVPS